MEKKFESLDLEEKIKESEERERNKNERKDRNLEKLKRLKRLRQKSTMRFRRRWERIIAKYSQIDDERESDEIDLLTGRIMRDNGHLKSLKSCENRCGGKKVRENIWALPCETGKILFDGKRSVKDVSDSQKMSLKVKEAKFYNDYEIKKDPPNKLCRTSPTKQAKKVHSRCNSETDFFSMNRFPIQKDIKQDSDVSLVPKPTDCLSNNSFDREDRIKHKSSYQKDSILCSQKSLSDTRNPFSEFNEEYLIIVEPYFLKNSHHRLTIFECPFFECTYCTGNKIFYRNHLLEMHSKILKSLGYPVSFSGKDNKMDYLPENGLAILTDQFPLKYEIPPFPLSKNKLPFFCNRTLLNDKKCQRFFLNEAELLNHRSTGNFCSFKTQVLLCPILGCNFTTTSGYLSWRDHILEKNHSESFNCQLMNKNNELLMKNKKLITEIQNTNKNEKSHYTDKNYNDCYKIFFKPSNNEYISENIDDLFSDSKENSVSNEFNQNNNENKLNDESDFLIDNIKTNKQKVMDPILNFRKVKTTNITNFKIFINDDDCLNITNNIEKGYESINDLFDT